MMYVILAHIIVGPTGITLSPQSHWVFAEIHTVEKMCKGVEYTPHIIKLSCPTIHTDVMIVTLGLYHFSVQL